MIGRSIPSISCDKTAPVAAMLSSTVTRNLFVNSGYASIGAVSSAFFNCMNAFWHSFDHIHGFLFAVSSFKGFAIPEKFLINRR